jgi:PAS domain-containing protein
VEFDMQGRVLAMNDKALAFYGYQPHEVVGMDHRAFAWRMTARARCKPCKQDRLWRRLNEGHVVCGRVPNAATRGARNSGSRQPIAPSATSWAFR